MSNKELCDVDRSCSVVSVVRSWRLNKSLFVWLGRGYKEYIENSDGKTWKTPSCKTEKEIERIT
jgi:hypothetical protein